MCNEGLIPWNSLPGHSQEELLVLRVPGLTPDLFRVSGSDDDSRYDWPRQPLFATIARIVICSESGKSVRSILALSDHGNILDSDIPYPFIGKRM